MILFNPVGEFVVEFFHACLHSISSVVETSVVVVYVARFDSFLSNGKADPFGLGIRAVFVFDGYPGRFEGGFGGVQGKG